MKSELVGKHDNEGKSGVIELAEGRGENEGKKEFKAVKFSSCIEEEMSKVN